MRFPHCFFCCSQRGSPAILWFMRVGVLGASNRGLKSVPAIVGLAGLGLQNLEGYKEVQISPFAYLLHFDYQQITPSRCCAGDPEPCYVCKICSKDLTIFYTFKHCMFVAQGVGGDVCVYVCLGGGAGRAAGARGRPPPPPRVWGCQNIALLPGPFH